MLFNSYAFVFGFLPLVLGGAHLCAARSGGAARAWLLLASFVFYGWWSPPFLGLLLGSIAFNFAIGHVLCDARGAPARRRGLLVLGVAGNLLLLTQCKYLRFLTEVANQLTGAELALPAIFLPLAISFFTFQQIAFLVDAWRGEVERPRLLHYALFVSFFPQLVAGPIVQHRELLPQLARRGLGRLSSRRLALGLTLFVIGLFKKVVLADGVSVHADPVFAAASAGQAVGAAGAWAGALAYSLQLYFDFSGYSDMAIGLGAMLGVRLPVNFDSPYQAGSVIDFWRRWHITLSRFLRQYLYFPLGGGRRGRWRQFANLLVTMLLGGLWHGAGWTFVAWGGVHGLLLAANHGWRTLHTRRCPDAAPPGAPARALGRAATFLAVTAAWVVFRADSLPAAGSLLHAMTGLAGVGVGPGSEVWGILAALLAVVWWAPNSQQWVALEGGTAVQPTPRLRWRPTPAWGLAVGLLGLLAVADLTQRSEFIYFRF